jgi:hypothetical protein
VPERRGVRKAGAIAACVIAALILVGLGAQSVHAQGGFVIAGEVDGLFPGAETTLDARLTNPHPFPIRVISTSAIVLDASPGCPASMLQIGDSQMTVVVPAGGTGTVPLHVRMSRSAPDECQGATWPLEFTGTAVGTAPTAQPDTSIDDPGPSTRDPRSLAALFAVGAALTLAGLLVFGRDRGGRGRRAS